MRVHLLTSQILLEIAWCPMNDSIHQRPRSLTHICPIMPQWVNGFYIAFQKRFIWVKMFSQFQLQNVPASPSRRHSIIGNLRQYIPAGTMIHFITTFRVINVSVEDNTHRVPNNDVAKSIKKKSDELAFQLKYLSMWWLIFWINIGNICTVEHMFPLRFLKFYWNDLNIMFRSCLTFLIAMSIICLGFSGIQLVKVMKHDVHAAHRQPIDRLISWNLSDVATHWAERG